MPEGRPTLPGWVSLVEAGYSVGRGTLAADLEALFPAGGPLGSRPSALDAKLTEAIVMAGAADAAVFAPAALALPREIDELDRSSPEADLPNLSALNVMNELQVMGLAVDGRVERIGRAWLAGMQTAGREPAWVHWTRGLAALALGDLATARTIAALPAAGRLHTELTVSPQVNIQGWFARFVSAVDEGLSWSAMRPWWEEFVSYFPVFLEVRELTDGDLAWVGRIMRNQLAGQPLGGVADWIHTEVRRLAARA